MKFGIRLPVNGPFASKKAIIEIAKLADDLGYHSVWTQGHLLWTKTQRETQISVGSTEALDSGEKDPNLFDSIVSLSSVSALTTNVRLGFSVFVAPLLHPIVAAKLLSDLDVLSGGRLIFCAAAGGPLIRADFESLGLDFAHRAEITDEYLSAILKLWTSDSTSFQGKYVKFENVSLYPKPIQKPFPETWVAGGDPNSTSCVAKYGTGWMLTTADPRSILTKPSDYLSKFERLNKISMSKYSKNVKDFALDIFACISSDDSAASQIASKTIQTRLNRQSTVAGLKVPSKEQIEAVNLIGSFKKITRMIEEFERAKVTLLEMKMICWSLEQMKDMMKDFHQNIMSSFQ